MVFILLSNCVGGPFGKKWTDVGAEWNERSEVHSSADGGPFFTNGTTKQFLSNLLSD